MISRRRQRRRRGAQKHNKRHAYDSYCCSCCYCGLYTTYVCMYLCMYIECSVTLPVENTKENSSLASSSSYSYSTTAAVYPSGHPEAVLIPRQKQIIWKKNIFDDIQNLWFWRKLCGAYVSVLFIYWLSVVKPSIWDQSLNIVFADVRKKIAKVSNW